MLGSGEVLGVRADPSFDGLRIKFRVTRRCVTDSRQAADAGEASPRLSLTKVQES